MLFIWRYLESQTSTRKIPIRDYENILDYCCGMDCCVTSSTHLHWERAAHADTAWVRCRQLSTHSPFCNALWRPQQMLHDRSDLSCCIRIPQSIPLLLFGTVSVDSSHGMYAFHRSPHAEASTSFVWNPFAWQLMLSSAHSMQQQ